MPRNSNDQGSAMNRSTMNCLSPEDIHSHVSMQRQMKYQYSRGPRLQTQWAEFAYLVRFLAAENLAFKIQMVIFTF